MSHSFVLASLASDRFPMAIFDGAVKGTVLLVVAWVVALVCRRCSAATRHLIWSTATAGLVMLPLATAWLPGWCLPWSVQWLAADPGVDLSRSFATANSVDSMPEEILDARPGDTGSTHSAGGRTLGAAEMREPVEEKDKAVTSAVVWLGRVWLFGAVALLLPTVVGWLSVQHLRRKYMTLASGPVAGRLAELAACYQIRRRVTLWECRSRQVPMTWGVWRPVVVLPTEAATWTRQRLDAVLRHELAHVARYDCLTQWVAQMARALHWFNPLAWHAVTRLRFEQEQACDDLVLAAGHSAADYAEQLLAVTSGRRSSRWAASAALSIGQARRLEHRLRTILDPNLRRSTLSLRQALRALFCGTVLLAPLAALDIGWAAEEPAAKAQAQNGDGDQKLSDDAEGGTKTDGELQRLREARTKVLEIYFRQLDTGKMTEGAIKGMLDALDDPYSEYLSPRQLADFDKQVGGNLVGIGAVLKTEAKEPEGVKIVVVTPLEDSPALKAGVGPDDEILAVDGNPIEGLALSEVIERVVGAKGTVVTLKLRHPGGDDVEIAIMRDQVNLPAIAGLRRGPDGHWDFWLDREHKIGYIHLQQFVPTTAVEMQNILGSLAKQDLHGLVLDLRACPGGMLSVAVEIANSFIAEGLIVSVKGRDKAPQEIKADGKAQFAEVPLVVLIDEQTASAAEVLTGALRQRKHTLLVGVRTFGKGSVQSIVNLGENQGALKLTTAFFQAPGGRNIDRHAEGGEWGIDPSDGSYVPLDAQQAARLDKFRRQRAVVRKSDAATLSDLTPEAVREQLSDPQLAAGLKALLARLKTGEFVAVGEPLPAEKPDGRREKLKAQQEALLKELRRLESELKVLDKSYELPTR